MTWLHVMGVPTGECPGLQERDVCAMKGGQLACQLPQPTCYNATWQLENLASGQPKPFGSFWQAFTKGCH